MNTIQTNPKSYTYAELDALAQENVYSDWLECTSSEDTSREYFEKVVIAEFNPTFDQYGR